MPNFDPFFFFLGLFVQVFGYYLDPFCTEA